MILNRCRGSPNNSSIALISFIIVDADAFWIKISPFEPYSNAYSTKLTASSMRHHKTGHLRISDGDGLNGNK